MGVQDEEKMPLVVDAATEARNMAEHTDIAVALPSESQERDWDGHLLQMCGNCDHTGLSSFALVKMLSACAWGHNMKKAFGASFWKHAIVFTLLFGFWTYMYLGAASYYGTVCSPHPPPPHPKDHMDMKPRPALDPKIFPDMKVDPQQQVFLSGSTLSTDLIPDENIQINTQGGNDQQPPGFTVIIDGEPTDLNAFEDVNAQVQNAKNQAMEGMNQLNTQLLGRKLRHKHDDEEHEHSDKKAKKDKKKKCKKNMKHHDDDDHDHHGPEWIKPQAFDFLGKDQDGFGEFPQWSFHPEPMSPEERERACKDASRNLVAHWLVLALSLTAGTLYAAKMRTAFRKRYGIKGSGCRDCMAWTWCAPCALCQETRTIMSNNIHNGKWHGPTVLASPLPQDPFNAPKQVSADKAPTVPDASLKV